MAGFKFEVIPADVDETADPAMPPDELVAFLSEKKAVHVLHQIQPVSSRNQLTPCAQPAQEVIVGADTVVAIDGLILGKPSGEDAAFDMLTRLQGRVHVVYTGVTVVSAKSRKTFVESTRVFMKSLTDAEIREYISTGEPMDKAGAYGIQERGAVLIERVEGDYFTVVGLPLCRLNIVLKSMHQEGE